MQGEDDTDTWTIRWRWHERRMTRQGVEKGGSKARLLLHGAGREKRVVWWTGQAALTHTHASIKASKCTASGDTSTGCPTRAGARYNLVHKATKTHPRDSIARRSEWGAA